MKNAYVPMKTAPTFSALSQLSETELIELGCGLWETVKGRQLWLFPDYWYNSIPVGFNVTTVDYAAAPFDKNTHPNEPINGYLMFGFIKNVEQPDVRAIIFKECA